MDNNEENTESTSIVMHFEDIWNKIEYQIYQNYPKKNAQNFINEIKKHLEGLESSKDPKERAEIVGSILYCLCGICLREGINSAAALKMHLKDL